MESPLSPNQQTHDNQDSSKDKARSRRPCDPCRRRKTRCELQHGVPPCLLCKFHRQDCTFNEDPRPRKRRAIAIDDDVEPRTESVRATNPHSQAKIRQHAAIDDYKNLRGPTLLKKTLGLQRNKHSRVVGPTSVFEHVLIELNEKDDDISVGVPTLRKVDSHGTVFEEVPDTVTRNADDDVNDLDLVESMVAPHGPALMRLYFRIVHPSFPILHKEVWLEKYNRTHREFSPPCLAGVYLMALNWWSYSAELAALPKPDVSRLEELALRSFSNVMDRPKLSTIQAGLLLLQRPQGGSWAMTAQVVALGQDLGLHLDCAQWRIPAWERGLRKRLSWALFMQDKWAALVHSRPSHLSMDDWDVRPLDEDDFPENARDDDDEDGSAEVEKGRVLFCAMVDLTKILAGILSSLFTRKAERDIAEHAQEGVRWILEIAKPHQLSLREFFSTLPPVLKMDKLVARKLSSSGYLHLGYYAIEMTLHRRIIRSLSSADDPALRTICRQAAQTRLKSAMDFVSGLRPEHTQAFWVAASEYNFALIGSFISLLWATALPDRQEAEMYRKALDEYRWMLRLCSKQADLHERAFNMLAASTGVLLKSVPDTSLLASAGGAANGSATVVVDRPSQRRLLERARLGSSAGEHVATNGHSEYVSPASYSSENEHYFQQQRQEQDSFILEDAMAEVLWETDDMLGSEWIDDGGTWMRMVGGADNIDNGGLQQGDGLQPQTVT